LTELEAETEALAFSGDGSRLFAGDADGRVTMFEVGL
jgi:hypothetical protein